MTINPLNPNISYQPIDGTQNDLTQKQNSESTSRRVSGLFDFFQKDRVSAGQIRQWVKEHVSTCGLNKKESGAAADKLFGAFQKLNKCSPESLKLIMSKVPRDFKIRICKNSSSFYSKYNDNKINQNPEADLGGTTDSARKDKITIELYADSLSYKYNFDSLIFHELFHVIYELTAKDNMEIFRELHMQNFWIRQMAADEKCYEKTGMYLSGLTKDCENENEYKKGIKILKDIASEYKLSWTLLELYDKKTKTRTTKRVDIKSIEDLFAEGLTAYFDKERRNLLQKEEPELYKLIEEVIIPKIKERAKELKAGSWAAHPLFADIAGT